MWVRYKGFNLHPVTQGTGYRVHSNLYASFSISSHVMSGLGGRASRRSSSSLRPQTFASVSAKTFRTCQI